MNIAWKVDVTKRDSCHRGESCVNGKANDEERGRRDGSYEGG